MTEEEINALADLIDVQSTTLQIIACLQLLRSLDKGNQTDTELLWTMFESKLRKTLEAVKTDI